MWDVTYVAFGSTTLYQLHCNTSALERIEHACLDLWQMFYGLSVQSVTFVHNLFVYAGDVISFFVMEFTSKLTSEIINIFRRKLENWCWQGDKFSVLEISRNRLPQIIWFSTCKSHIGRQCYLQIQSLKQLFYPRNRRAICGRSHPHQVLCKYWNL